MCHMTLGGDALPHSIKPKPRKGYPDAGTGALPAEPAAMISDIIPYRGLDTEHSCLAKSCALASNLKITSLYIAQSNVTSASCQTILLYE